MGEKSAEGWAGGILRAVETPPDAHRVWSSSFVKTSASSVEPRRSYLAENPNRFTFYLSRFARYVRICSARYFAMKGRTY